MSDVAQLKIALEAANARIAELEAQLPPPGPPVNVDVPYVGGVGSVGQTLTCTMGNWEGAPTAYEYGWRADGAPTGGAGPTYTVMPGDVGFAISCIVMASNAGGSTTAPESNAVVIEDVVQAEAARRRQEGRDAVFS